MQHFYYITILLRNQNQKWGLVLQAATENTSEAFSTLDNCIGKVVARS